MRNELGMDGRLVGLGGARGRTQVAGENTGGRRVQEIRFDPEGWTDIGGL